MMCHISSRFMKIRGVKKKSILFFKKIIKQVLHYCNKIVYYTLQHEKLPGTNSCTFIHMGKY